MSDWFETLDGLWTQFWLELGEGVADRSHPARHPTFSTVSREGWPEARTVVLRAADKAVKRIEAHTDLMSDKITSLRSNPRTAFHFWIDARRLQIRLQTKVEILHGAEVKAQWERVPDHSKQSYGITPHPGTPISNSLDYEKVPDPVTFAVLSCSIETIDLVHLGTEHRRARFTRARDWNGEWLAP